MKLFKNLFKRDASKKATSDNINSAVVDRIEVERIDVLAIKFKDMATGEIRLVEYNDHEGFDECMSNKNMRIIFD